MSVRSSTNLNLVYFLGCSLEKIQKRESRLDPRGTHYHYPSLSPPSVLERFVIGHGAHSSCSLTCVFVCAVHDGYKVGSDMTVSLEFRTSQSEGVFLGISSAKVDAVGLELMNGQVSYLQLPLHDVSVSGEAGVFRDGRVFSSGGVYREQRCRTSDGGFYGSDAV